MNQNTGNIDIHALIGNYQDLTVVGLCQSTSRYSSTTHFTNNWLLLAMIGQNAPKAALCPIVIGPSAGVVVVVVVLNKVRQSYISRMV